MKKIIAIILCFLLLSACTPAENGENTDMNEELTESTDDAVSMGGMMGIANPISSYDTAEEVEAVTGILLNIPERAENTAFSTITGTIAQARFTLDGIEYTLRASKEAPTAALHGIYADIVSTEGFATTGGLTVTATNLGDAYSVCEWEFDGAFYSLSRDGVEDMSMVVEMVMGFVD